MLSLLLLEPARLFNPRLCRPLGVQTLKSYLEARGGRCTYRDLHDLLQGHQGGDMASTLLSLLRDDIQAHDIIALSVTYAEGFPVVLRLCELLRRHYPGKTIVAGGRYMVSLYLASRLTASLLEGHFPFVFLFDGERAMHLFLQGGAREEIPNLVYLKEGRVVVNPIRNDLNMADLPLVVGEGQERIVEYEVGRGCYWGRCRFCEYGYPQFPRDFHREKPIETILGDLAVLEPLIDHRPVFFITDAMSLSMARRLSEGLVEAGLCLPWLTYMRFEEGLSAELLSLMRRAGCMMLIFGLEAGSDRVNREVIDKGIDLTTAKRVLKACHSQGILTTVSSMTGLPSETLGEALETVTFLYQNRGSISEATINPYTMFGCSEYVSSPGRFGIRKVLPWGQKYFFFAKGGAMYRNLLSRPLVALSYLLFNLLTDINFLGWYSTPAVRLVQHHVVDRLLGQARRERASKEAFWHTARERVREMVERREGGR